MALPSAWSARGGLAECSYPVHSSLHEASSQPTTLRGSGYSCRLYRKYSSCRNAANDRNSNAALRPHYETAQGGQNHAAPRPRSCRNLHKGSMAASRSMALRAAVDAASTAAADLSPRAREEAAVGLDRLQNGNSVHTDRGSNGAAVPQASPGGGTTPAVHAEAAVAPEDFQLAAGELSTIDRGTACAPGDVFRCTACTRPECQGEAGCQQMQWRNEAGGYLREILTARVYDVAVETPLELAAGLSVTLDNRLFLKREDLQQVFSFKLRGAYNKMASLSAEQRARGVITSSAGNHAQGVSLAAAKLGCRALVCMPLTTPDIKVDAVRRLGGEVELIGESYSETQAHAQARARAEGMVFVAPYDDPYTIAGQGTIGNELLRQLNTPDLDALHAIFVAIGGGGLIAGVAAYVKALRPDIKIIGVEPTGANAMAMSLARGRRVTLSKVDAFADGVAVKQVGAETFRLCRRLLDGVVLVDNSAISAAIKDVFNETRSILEPAGAVAVAGAKAYLQREGLKGMSAVAVTSGANMNFDRLRLVTELADVGALREAMLATTIPERPGSFAAFLDAALPEDSGLQITEFKYRYSAAAEAHILWGLGIRDRSEVAQLSERLAAAGMPTIDISGIEAAQVHLRHLVGGRARSYMGELPHERIFQVDFPERTGALKRFLSVVSPAFHITLFHYRKTGNRSTKLLIGMQVPPAEQEHFAAAQAQLADDYTFEELSGQARQVFAMFIS